MTGSSLSLINVLHFEVTPSLILNEKRLLLKNRSRYFATYFLVKISHIFVSFFFNNYNFYFIGVHLQVIF